MNTDDERPLGLGRCYTGERNGAPQRRKQRHDGWTDKRRERFLETLAATCNVRASVRAAGMSADSAYKLRDRDPGFREAWCEALAQGYDRLELALLDRAINGTAKPVFRGNRKVGEFRIYNDAVALRLLQAHRDSAENRRQHGGRTPEEVFEEIKRRIAKIRERETRALPAP